MRKSIIAAVVMAALSFSVSASAQTVCQKKCDGKTQCDKAKKECNKDGKKDCKMQCDKAKKYDKAATCCKAKTNGVSSAAMKDPKMASCCKVKCDKKSATCDKKCKTAAKKCDKKK